MHLEEIDNNKLTFAFLISGLRFRNRGVAQLHSGRGLGAVRLPSRKLPAYGEPVPLLSILSLHPCREDPSCTVVMELHPTRVIDDVVGGAARSLFKGVGRRGIGDVK